MREMVVVVGACGLEPGRPVVNCRSAHSATHRWLVRLTGSWSVGLARGGGR